MVYVHGSASAGKLEIELGSLIINAPLDIRDELLSPLYRLFHSLTVPFSGLDMLTPITSCEKFAPLSLPGRGQGT